MNKQWTDTFLVPIAWTLKNISSRCLCIFTRRITGFNSRPQRRNPKFSAWEFLQIFAPFSIISGINCWGALILWNSRVLGFIMFHRLVSQTLSDPDLFPKCRWLHGRVKVSDAAIFLANWNILKSHSNVKWMVRGDYTSSFRFQTAPLGKSKIVYVILYYTFGFGYIPVPIPLAVKQ